MPSAVPDQLQGGASEALRMLTNSLASEDWNNGGARGLLPLSKREQQLQEGHSQYWGLGNVKTGAETSSKFWP